MKEINVYDKVWVMESNYPTEKFVYSKNVTMNIITDDQKYNYYHKGEIIIYRLISKGEFNDKSLRDDQVFHDSIPFDETKVFLTKDELIKSLY